MGYYFSGVSGLLTTVNCSKDRDLLENLFKGGFLGKLANGLDNSVFVGHTCFLDNFAVCSRLIPKGNRLKAASPPSHHFFPAGVTTTVSAVAGSATRTLGLLPALASLVNGTWASPRRCTV